MIFLILTKFHFANLFINNKFATLLVNNYQLLALLKNEPARKI